jgi:hypothetical protein
MSYSSTFDDEYVKGLGLGFTLDMNDEWVLRDLPIPSGLPPRPRLYWPYSLVTFFLELKEHCPETWSADREAALQQEMEEERQARGLS